MSSLTKYCALALAFAFLTAFTPSLSAKHHHRCHSSTSFSFNFLSGSRFMAPAREVRYIERAPRYDYYYSPRPYVTERYVERSYPVYRERETVIVERAPYWY